MKYKTAVKKLEKIKDNFSNSELKRNVAESIIDDANGYETIDNFFRDLLEHGCISGMISGLIYYADTHKFFDDNYSDIMDLLENIKDETGEEFSNWNGDIKNTGAWLAYEETARDIACELGIEI